MYYTNESRGVMLLFYIVVLLFGTFQINTRGFLHISIFILISYLIDIILLCNNRPQYINSNTEFVQLLMLASILVIFSIIGGQISALREKLRDSKSQQAKYIETIKELAIRDELTGLYNRRYLMELIDFEKNRSSRDNSTFCIALMDIDHFKNVNDTFGHQTGDVVLREVAVMMEKTLRDSEFCGRYGGEEFLIVLTQTDRKGAFNAVERVRANIADLQLQDSNASFKVTVSIGLAEYRKGEGAQETIARADQAMYCAKEGGRNRVEVHL
jgi:diguanylate cyclase (GGDEF)-like protein